MEFIKKTGYNKMFTIVFTFLLLLLSKSSIAQNSRSVNSYIGSRDINRLENVFRESIISNDLQAIYYSSGNIKTSEINDKNNICQKLITLHTESNLNNYEKDFYLIGSHKNLLCKEKLPEPLLSKVSNALKKDTLSTSQEIFYRVASNNILGSSIDESTITRITKSLQDALKKDDTLPSLGYAFNVAPELGASCGFLADRLADVVVQVDEVDGKMLQFEGGLSITALLVNGIFKVTNTYKLSPAITAEQAVKFANYFLSRRSVQTAKGVHVLLESLKTLQSLKQISPIAIQVIGNGQLHSDTPLNIAVVDLLGKPISSVPQNIFGKIVLKKDNTVLAEKVQFSPKSSDKTIFATDLSNYKPTRGIYEADIIVDSIYKQKVQFKVLGRVKVQTIDLSVADSATSGTIKKESIKFPNLHKDVITADTTQKLNIKAVLTDEMTGKVISVHQAFIRLYNKDSDQEIIFIAEQDSSKSYKFDMEISSNADNFEHKSGIYEVYLTIGDSSISNSFDWHVANVHLKFVQGTKNTTKPIIRSALPEIIHQFRPPEKRPPRFVSDIFTGLCLMPLVLLPIFWTKLGINISNFSLSPSTIGFHLGFGGILALFFVFWIGLNMFQTLRLLIPIAIFTFLCGNRLLRGIYLQRISKTSSAQPSS